MLFLFVLIVSFFVSALIIGYSLYYGITPMPTSIKTKKSLLTKLEVIESGIIYELGSGWGGIAIVLAKQYPQCQIIAYEISPIPYYFSFFKVKLLGLSNISIQRKDFFKENLTEARAIYCYLYPKAMQRLEAKCNKELKQCTLYSNTFSWPHKQTCSEEIKMWKKT